MGSTVLVTGGAKRIGRAICTRLAKDGHAIVVQYLHSETEASDLVSKISSMGGSAVALQSDLSQIASASTLVEEASGSMGPISGLVNNASLFYHDEISTLDELSWNAHMNLNARAPALLIRALVDCLEDGARASVVNILDQKLASPNPDHLSYTVSKFALLGLTETLARGLAPLVRVNAVAPGHTIPSSEQTKSGFAKAQSETPLGHGPEPREIADAVSFLMQAKSITGQVIFVDSGERFLSRTRDVTFETED